MNGAKMLDKYTFGRSKAAVYLADVLNLIKNQSLTRYLTNSIERINIIEEQITIAVESGYMSPSVAANLLRLVRKEVTEIQADTYASRDDLLAYSLARNVMIARLKPAINAFSRQSNDLKKEYSKKCRNEANLKRQEKLIRPSLSKKILNYSFKFPFTFIRK